MIEIEGYDWPHEEATVTWSRFLLEEHLRVARRRNGHP
jgi:hypothetical protein